MPTPRYRTVGDGASVDESLFGSSKSSTMGRSTRRIVTGPIGPSDTVLTESELSRIAHEAIIKTEAQYQAEKDAALEAKAAKERKAGERKLRMKELEKKAVAAAKKSDEEVATLAKAATLRAMAQEKVDKNSDVVKMLNSMSARAIAFSVRDRQLHEKEERERVDDEIDRRLDILMEIDRLKDLDRRETEEREKILKRAKDREVITEQIQAREKMRLMELEAREQESQAMRSLMAKHLEEDKRNAEIRQREVEKSRLEVAIANAASIEAKKAARESAAWAAKAAWPAIDLPAEGRLHLWLDFYPPDRRQRDDDGLLSSMKAARDGIADALGINDSRFVSHPYIKDEVRKGGMVEIRITPEVGGMR